MKDLSKITIVLAIFIIISASFMLQVRNFLVDIFSEEAVQVSFFCLLLIALIGYFSYLLYSGISIYRLVLTVGLFVAAYFLISKQQYFAEKLHVVEYGVLGYLAFRDLSKKKRNIFSNVTYAAFFIILVSILDEGFQRILPYRVFEVKDVITNVLSGFLGVLGYGIVNYHSVLPRKP